MLVALACFATLDTSTKISVSMVPVITEGRAAGSSTRRIVAIFVLPSAYEASRT